MDTWNSLIHDSIRRYVREEHGGVVKKAAQALGIKYETFRSWHDQVKSPTLESISPYMEQLGFPLPSIRRVGSHAPVEAVSGKGLPKIPVVGSTGAGLPTELFSLKPETVIEVLPQYNYPSVVAMHVDGDSMEPTVRKGAYVGVVPFDGEISEGGIYLVHIPPFGRTIKRLRISSSGGISLHSDNKSYDPINLENEDYENTICGKVVWIWQEC